MAKKKAARKRPEKKCPKCDTMNPARSGKCSNCGHEFQRAEKKAPTSSGGNLKKQLQAERTRLQTRLTAIDTLLSD